MYKLKIKVRILKQSCIIILLFFVTVALLYAKEYKRIISLAPSVTESLYELGEEQFLKGITVYCCKGTTKKEIIGTLLEPNIEKITLLAPDLIVCSKEGNSKVVVEKLRRLGFEVYVMETFKNFNDICVSYYDLSKKLDKAKEAKEIINMAKYSVKEIYSKLEGMKELKLFWEIGAKPLYTAGGKSFVNDYNYYTKTINIYKNVEMRYLCVNIENVLKYNPDIVLLVNRKCVSSKEITNWNKYTMINAVKNGKIFMIDSVDMFTPTPLVFARNVKMLAKVICGEIF
jgi:iron complex transport system substrate-binding protein